VFGFLYYSIAGMAQIKGKLFGTGEEENDRPSEKDNQKKYELFDQFGIHKPSSFSQRLEIIFIFSKKIVY
jgi:hypothetical protein